MSTLAEWLGHAALGLVAWTVLSVLAVWPIVWWMRGQAAENERALTLAAGQPSAAPASGPLTRPLTAESPPGR
jgi:hypothetical protein